MTNDNISIRLKELNEPFQALVQNLESSLKESNLKAKVVRSLVGKLIQGDFEIVKDITGVDGLRIITPADPLNNRLPVEIQSLVSSNLDLLETILEVLNKSSTSLVSSSASDTLSPPEQHKLHCISITTLLEKILQQLAYAIQNWSRPNIDKQNVIDFMSIAYQSTIPKYKDSVFSTQEAISFTPPPGGIELQAYAYTQCLRSLIELLYSKVGLLIVADTLEENDNLVIDFAVALIYTAMRKDLFN